jgi:hypothetical protein
MERIAPSRDFRVMFEFLAWLAAAFAGAIYLLSPPVVRSTFRFFSRCQFHSLCLERLPEKVSAEFRRRISEFDELGFALLGCFDCGALANDTHSYIAYCCNHATHEFATVSALITPLGAASYFEFSSRFSNGCSIATNDNGILPLLPANPEIRVFRFAFVQEPRALLQIHRQITAKYAPGRCALGEPRDEIQRYVRMLESVGPRLAQGGYMKLREAGDCFGLTWKGAIRMTWLGLWPVTLVRKVAYRHAMQSELGSLRTHAVAALENA